MAMDSEEKNKTEGEGARAPEKTLEKSPAETIGESETVAEAVEKTTGAIGVEATRATEMITAVTAVRDTPEIKNKVGLIEESAARVIATVRAMNGGEAGGLVNRSGIEGGSAVEAPAEIKYKRVETKLQKGAWKLDWEVKNTPPLVQRVIHRLAQGWDFIKWASNVAGISKIITGKDLANGKVPDLKTDTRKGSASGDSIINPGKLEFVPELKKKPVVAPAEQGAPTAGPIAPAPEPTGGNEKPSAPNVDVAPIKEESAEPAIPTVIVPPKAEAPIETTQQKIDALNKQLQPLEDEFGAIHAKYKKMMSKPIGDDAARLVQLEKQIDDFRVQKNALVGKLKKEDAAFNTEIANAGITEQIGADAPDMAGGEGMFAAMYGQDADDDNDDLSPASNVETVAPKAEPKKVEPLKTVEEPKSVPSGEDAPDIYEDLNPLAGMYGNGENEVDTEGPLTANAVVEQPITESVEPKPQAETVLAKPVVAESGAESAEDPIDQFNKKQEVLNREARILMEEFQHDYESIKRIIAEIKSTYDYIRGSSRIAALRLKMQVLCNGLLGKQHALTAQPKHFSIYRDDKVAVLSDKAVKSFARDYYNKKEQEISDLVLQKHDECFAKNYTVMKDHAGKYLLSYMRDKNFWEWHSMVHELENTLTAPEGRERARALLGAITNNKGFIQQYEALRQQCSDADFKDIDESLKSTFADFQKEADAKWGESWAEDSASENVGGATEQLDQAA